MHGMATKDNAELEGKIMERLENGDSRNDILLDLCESANMNWSEAEALLDELQAENQGHITLTQSPLLVLIALAGFIGGAGLIFYSISDLIYKYSIFQASHAGMALAFIGYIFASGEAILGMLILGMAMIIGSLRGMQAVWTAIFDKFGLFQNGK